MPYRNKKNHKKLLLLLNKNILGRSKSAGSITSFLLKQILQSVEIQEMTLILQMTNLLLMLKLS